MRHKKTASVPTSGDAGSQGGQASPNNPTKKPADDTKKLTEKIDLRCTLAEKNAIKRKAELAGVSSSQLLREALELTDPKRRKPPPAVPTDTLIEVAQTTRSLQLLASVATRKISVGYPSELLEMTALIAALISIDRRLADLQIGFGWNY